MKARPSNILTKLFAIALVLVNTFSTSAQAPLANFTATPSAGCSPLVVSFQDLSTGNPASWSWDFGNGNTSTLRNPTATYFTTGTYSVSLTVTNASGSNLLTRNQYITVYETPSAAMDANPLTGCFPLHVQCFDHSTAGAGNTNTTWLWDFGNGTTSTLQNPATTYTTAGSYTLTMKVTNDKGCVATVNRQHYIDVTDGVIAGFTHTDPQECAAPSTVQFTNTSTGPGVMGWHWDFGDGTTSSSQHPAHTYNANGTYTVTLVAFSPSGCADTFRLSPLVIGSVHSAISFTNPVCVNNPAVFTNATVPAPVSAFWTFGNGSYSTGIDASFNYTVPGNYTVTLYNTFDNCEDSVSVNLTVLPQPTANFTSSNTTFCTIPATVSFQDLSSGSPSSWAWDFGDGNTSTLQNPSHTYFTPGTYNVSLTVYNAGGCFSRIIKERLVVIRRATININNLPAEGCVPFTITPVPVITNSAPIIAYQWNFGDGSTSTLQNPVHTYNTQGSFTVQLIITTNTGCTDTLTMADAVRTGTKPHADFTAGPIPVCGKTPVMFNNLSTPANCTWTWNFGDGNTSSQTNPSHAYLDTGYFNISLIANNNGCRDTMIRNNYVQINPPIALFVFTMSCTDRKTVVFNDYSVAAQTWDWNFGDGTHSSAQSPSHTYAAYGAYVVTLHVSNGGCVDSTLTGVYVIDENPDFTVNNQVTCKQTALSFTATNVTPSNIRTYTWRFGDGLTFTSNSNTVNHAYSLPGNYTVTLITKDLNGCLDSVTKTSYVRVNGPSANFITSQTSGCAPSLVLFNDLSLNDGINPITSWKWNFGDGHIEDFTAAPYIHTYTANGIFSVKLVVTDAAGCLDSLLRPNYIHTTKPTAGFKVSDTLNCPGGNVNFINLTQPAGYTSEWLFGDGARSTQQSPIHSYSDTGTYTVSLRVTDTYGCGDTLVKPDYIHVGKPVAGFSLNDSISSCIPVEIRLTNTSLYTSSVLWDFGAGQGNTNMNNPVHFYSTPGTHTITLYAISPGGCVDSTSQTISIFDHQGATVKYLPIDGCKPVQVALNVLSPGPVNSYLWDFGDGYTDTTETPVNNHLYASFGNFLPKVIMRDPAGCLVPVQGLDTVYVTGARAKFGLGQRIFCDKGFVQFSDSTSFNDPITSYSWNFGDGNYSSQHSPSHTYYTPGIYTVSLSIVTSLGCSDTMTKQSLVTIHAGPKTDIIGDTLICINNTLKHTPQINTPDTGPLQWQWVFPNGNHYTIQDPPEQHFNTAGDFTVLSIATNAVGCSDTTTKNIHIKPLPTVSMPGVMTVQNGFPVKIPAQFSAGTQSWIWSPADGLDNFRIAQPMADPHFNTIYQVYFTDQYGCSNRGQVEAIVICKNANLFIPNTFSPNGDGQNDVFYPRGKGLERVKMMRIFNRWGEIVFESRDFPVNNPAYGWNGRFKGGQPQADVYVYQAEVYCNNGEVIKLNGNIALLQ